MLPMGHGKTHAVLDFLKMQSKESRSVVMTPRISLASNIYGKSKEFGLDFTYYKQPKTSAEKEAIIGVAQNLIVGIHSLKYVKYEYDIVIIDEFETVLLSWADADLHGDLGDVDLHFSRFCKLLQKAKKVILLDAFMSKRAVKFIKSIDPDGKILVIGSSTPAPTRSLHLLNIPTKASDPDAPRPMTVIMAPIKQAIKDNKRIFIYYPRKRGGGCIPKGIEDFGRKIKELLKKHNRPPKVLVYHADSSDKKKKQLQKPEEHWADAEVVIYNGTITVGVDFNTPDIFHCGFLILQNGFGYPRDVIQASYRIRNLIDDEVFAAILPGIQHDKIFEGSEYDNSVYQALCDDIRVEALSPTAATFKMLAKRAGYQIQNVDVHVDDALKAFMSSWEQDADLMWSYSKVPLVDSYNMNLIKGRVYEEVATMADKIQLQKFFFNTLFVKDTPENIKEYLWDHNKTTVILRYRDVLQDPDHLFLRLIKAVGTDIDISNIEELLSRKPSDVSAKTVEDVKLYIQSRSHYSKSSPVKLAALLFKSFFQMDVLKAKYDEHRNASWSVSKSFTQLKTMLASVKFLKV